MTTTATSNPALNFLAPPARDAAGTGRGGRTTEAASGTDSFAQALQQRIERARSQAGSPPVARPARPPGQASSAGDNTAPARKGGSDDNAKAAQQAAAAVAQTRGEPDAQADSQAAAQATVDAVAQAGGQPATNPAGETPSQGLTLAAEASDSAAQANGDPAATAAAAIAASIAPLQATADSTAVDAPAAASSGLAPDQLTADPAAIGANAAGNQVQDTTDEVSAAIAGVPAAIAAILQELAGSRGQPAPAGQPDGRSSGLPQKALRPVSGDSTVNPLQNRGTSLPAGAAEAGAAAGMSPGAPMEAQATPTDKVGARSPAAFAAELQSRGAQREPVAAGEPAAAAREQRLPIQASAQGEQPAPNLVAAGTVGGQVPVDVSASNIRQPAQLPVHTPVGDSAWADDVGSRVTLLVGRGESKAELVLTPPSLGRIEVSLTVEGDNTTAQFVAATPAARDALEQALPRLREVLQQAGVSLGQTQVSTSSDQQARQDEGQRGRSPRRGGGIDGVEATAGAGTTSAAGWLRYQEGMVDTFA